MIGKLFPVQFLPTASLSIALNRRIVQKGRLKQGFRRPFCTDKSGRRYVSEGRKRAKAGVGAD